MHHALTVAAEILGAGAVVTFIGTQLIERGLGKNLAEQTARYGALSVPTVVMSGDRDMVVPPRQARAFAAAVPSAKLIVLPGIGHMLHHVAAERAVAEIEEIAARYSADLSSPT